jgi:hypothetical protein
MFRRLLPTLLCCWLASNAAAAATLDGVTVPDSYTVDGQSFALNGLGLRTLTIFRIKAYVAGLYLPSPSHDARQILASREPKIILLKFIRAASKARVEKQYRAGERDNCGEGGCAPSDQADFERLVAAAPAVKPGDTFTYILNAKGVQVFANNRMIGDFADLDLAYRLLSGFIGNHPPSVELRSGLLGLPSG